MTARALPEDAPPCVAPVERPQFRRVFGALSFPGGVCDTSSFVEAHPGGVTPTSHSSPDALVCFTLKDLDGALAEARRLVDLKRFDEARFELGQVVALAREAIGWLT